MCLKTVVPAIKNVGERFATKNYSPVKLLSAIRKILENLVNNRLVDNLKL